MVSLLQGWALGREVTPCWWVACTPLERSAAGVITLLLLRGQTTLLQVQEIKKANHKTPFPQTCCGHIHSTRLDPTLKPKRAASQSTSGNLPTTSQQ